MRRLSPEDVARANVDPTSAGACSTASRAACGLPAVAGGASPQPSGWVRRRGRPPDLPQPEYSTVGTDRTRTTFFEAPPPVGTTARALRAMDRVNNRRER